MLESLTASSGIYVAMFAVAVVSGVFPLVNAELALIAVALEGPSTEKLVLLAIIVAAGQTITHTLLYVSAREVTSLSAKRRAKLEARIVRGREIVARWGNKTLLVLFSSATLGVPPMMLAGPIAGALGIRLATFIQIGLVGRVLRFGAIAIAASLV